MAGVRQHYLSRFCAAVFDAIAQRFLRDSEDAERRVFGEVRGKPALMKVDPGLAILDERQFIT